MDNFVYITTFSSKFLRRISVTLLIINKLNQQPHSLTHSVSLLQPLLQFDPEPYQFSHAVADDEFTNYQTRQESQDENGVVQGEYSWVGPDSIRYITRYTADPINGFQVTEERRSWEVDEGGTGRWSAVPSTLPTFCFLVFVRFVAMIYIFTNVLSYLYKDTCYTYTDACVKYVYVFE